jgi:CRP/FNR family transcriptional regulator, cyclic AMP receptor protein
MSGSKKLEAGHYLFREGEAPDCMYVVKSGKLAVVKSKANNEIVLAEIGPGAMVGEMAFFDDKPRSASVKAMKDTEVILLPYKALRAQFSQFPEWAKAIMRTVNTSLRNANMRIKELESTKAESDEMFPPHLVTRLISILNLIGQRYGKVEADGLHVPGGVLRNYTIQIFQEPTHKMQKLLNALMEIELLKVEDLGEGRQKIQIFKPDLLFQFVEWYNEWLFKQDKDKVLVKEEELKILKCALHFAKKQTPDPKGFVKLNLSEIQNESMRELGFLVKVEEFIPLIEKKIMSDQMMEPNGLSSMIQIADMEKVVPFWSIIYSLKKVTRNS